MSPGGIFAQSDSVLPPETHLEMMLQLPSGWASASGTVQSSRKGNRRWGLLSGMGVKLTNVSPEVKAYLATLAPSDTEVPLATADEDGDDEGPS